jgi:hypothetical protein
VGGLPLIYTLHMRKLGLIGFGVLLAATASGCKKQESGASSGVPSASAVLAAQSPSAGAVTPSVATAVSGELLAGLDTCLVGNWRGTAFSMHEGPVSASGGAKLLLKIQASGDSELDFKDMEPVHGSAGVGGFDFNYSGTATAKLATPTRGAVTSSNPDYSKLKVSVTVAMPSGPKMPIFKDKPVSELAQMASQMAGKPGGAQPAAPAGVDSSPVFSVTKYTCSGDDLKLLAEKAGVTWTFTRSKG